MDTLIAFPSAVLAAEVTAKREGLYLTVEGNRYFIPWNECSETLANANRLERTYIDLMPSDYGIHWPPIHEDFAVGPLVKGRTPLA